MIAREKLEAAVLSPDPDAIDAVRAERIMAAADACILEAHVEACGKAEDTGFTGRKLRRCGEWGWYCDDAPRRPE